MSLLFNMLSKFVIAFLPRSKCLLVSWQQSPSAVILEPKKKKSLTIFIVSHRFAMKWWNQMPWSSFFECLVLRYFFLLSSFSFIKRLFSSSSLLFFLLGWCHLHIWGCWYFTLHSYSSLCFIQSSISHDVLCI